MMSVCEGVAICWSEAIRLGIRCGSDHGISFLDQALHFYSLSSDSAGSAGAFSPLACAPVQCCVLIVIARLASWPDAHSQQAVAPSPLGFDENRRDRYLNNLLHMPPSETATSLVAVLRLGAVRALCTLLTRNGRTESMIRSAWILAAETVQQLEETLSPRLEQALLALGRVLFRLDRDAALLDAASRRQLMLALDKLL